MPTNTRYFTQMQLLLFNNDVPRHLITFDITPLYSILNFSLIIISLLMDNSEFIFAAPIFLHTIFFLNDCLTPISVMVVCQQLCTP